MTWDCTSCGACCCNTKQNIAEGFIHYVRIDQERSKLLTDRSLRKKLVTTDENGLPHMRLLANRCAALQGRIGDRVHCSVYPHRPRVCRRVQPGDSDCLHARAEQGIF